MNLAPLEQGQYHSPTSDFRFRQRYIPMNHGLSLLHILRAPGVSLAPASPSILLTELGVVVVRLYSLATETSILQ